MPGGYDVALDRIAEEAPAGSGAGPPADAAHPFAGQHLLLAYESCEADLEDEAALDAAMRRAIAATGATVMGAVARRFEPQGLTLLYVLAESHASLHTYPEHRGAFADIFTCGKRCAPERFDEALREHLRPARAHDRLVER